MSKQNTFQVPRKYVFALAFIRGLIVHGVLRANIKMTLPLVGMFRNREIEIDIPLVYLKTLVSTFNLAMK